MIRILEGMPDNVLAWRQAARELDRGGDVGGRKARNGKLRAWERVAVVTDKDLLMHLSRRSAGWSPKRSASSRSMT